MVKLYIFRFDIINKKINQIIIVDIEIVVFIFKRRTFNNPLVKEIVSFALIAYKSIFNLFPVKKNKF